MSTERLRIAEDAVWSAARVQPDVETLTLGRIGCDIRAQISGSGPPVILVHGGVTAGASWAPLIGHLPDFRCIAIDRPGCGSSDPLPHSPQSVADAARIADDLVVDVMDALELPRAHVIGTSLGGWSTFRGAVAHPDRYDRIVMMSYSVGMNPSGVPLSMRMPTPPAVAKYMSKLATPRIMRALLKPAGLKRAIEEGKFSAVMIDWMVALMKDTNTMTNELAGKIAPMTVRGPIEEVLFTSEFIERITAPTLVLWGEEDPMSPFREGENFVANLPDGTIQLVRQAGHAPWVDEPQLTADAVRAHLNLGT